MSKVKVFPSETRRELRKTPNAKDVAIKLGMHITTVYRHSLGMDLKLIRRMKALDLNTSQMVQYLRKEGLTPADIAKALGVTISYVSGVLND